jgi:uncharacterized protein (TIGR02246 family)
VTYIELTQEAKVMSAQPADTVTKALEDAITQPIHAFSVAWAQRSGTKMADVFTDDAHFIAFDGTRLKGAKAIGDWHQPSLDTRLRNTTLDSRVDEIRMLTDDLALVTGSGGPVDKSGSARSRRMGESHETFLVKRLDSGEWKLLSLQVTRWRPINAAANAVIWKAFNLAWATFAKRLR